MVVPDSETGKTVVSSTQRRLPVDVDVQQTKLSTTFENVCTKTVTQLQFVETDTLETRKIECPVRVLFKIQTPEKDGQ